MPIMPPALSEAEAGGSPQTQDHRAYKVRSCLQIYIKLDIYDLILCGTERNRERWDCSSLVGKLELIEEKPVVY